MRIVAGELGGRRLRAPRGTDTRPTSERAREALFSRLGEIDGVEVLDLFAGSGALGFEALSRGAAGCLFVDASHTALRCVRANAEALGVTAQSRFRRADFKAALRQEAAAGRLYGLLLVDPPYARLEDFLPDLRELLAPLAAPGAQIAIEAPADLALDLPFHDHTVRRYGGTATHVFQCP